MKPYYQDDLVTLYHGDCREILPSIRADFVLTDPPYGIAYDASHTKYKNGIDRGVAEWDNDPYDPSPIIRLGLPSMIWGGNCFSSRLPDSTAWAVWVKIARQDADIRQSDCEMAWTNCLGRSRVFTHLWIGAYRDSESGETNIHPTQKPIALMKWCLTIAKAEGVILDPYCGSGTTLRAAKDMGLKSIGIEREEKYCAVTVSRLRQGSLSAMFQP